MSRLKRKMKKVEKSLTKNHGPSNIKRDVSDFRRREAHLSRKFLSHEGDGGLPEVDGRQVPAGDLGGGCEGCGGGWRLRGGPVEGRLGGGPSQTTTESTERGGTRMEQDTIQPRSLSSRITRVLPYIPRATG